MSSLSRRRDWSIADFWSCVKEMTAPLAIENARILRRLKTVPLMTPITWLIFVGFVLAAYGILLLGQDR
jgi:hypothetical protein